MTRRNQLPPWVPAGSRRGGRPYQPPLRRLRTPHRVDTLSDPEWIILGVLIGVIILCIVALLTLIVSR